jgi:hypothetical protein
MAKKLGARRANWTHAPHFAEAPESREVALLTSDIEVRDGNNAYVVRIVKGVPHILIPAFQNDDYPWGDSMLSSYERKRVIEIALGETWRSNTPSLKTRLTTKAKNRGKESERGCHPLGMGCHRRAAHGTGGRAGFSIQWKGLRQKLGQFRGAANGIIDLILNQKPENKTPSLASKKEIDARKCAAGLKSEQDTRLKQAGGGISPARRTSVPAEATRPIPERPKLVVKETVGETEQKDFDFAPEGKQRVGCNRCHMLNINGVPCHVRGCPSERAWDPNTLPLDPSSRPDCEYGQRVDRKPEFVIPPPRLYTSSSPGSCGVCSSLDVYFDWGRDFHICGGCGAHEAVGGWQKP